MYNDRQYINKKLKIIKRSQPNYTPTPYYLIVLWKLFLKSSKQDVEE